MNLYRYLLDHGHGLNSMVSTNLRTFWLPCSHGCFFKYFGQRPRGFPAQLGVGVAECQELCEELARWKMITCYIIPGELCETFLVSGICSGLPKFCLPD